MDNGVAKCRFCKAQRRSIQNLLQHVQEAHPLEYEEFVLCAEGNSALEVRFTESPVRRLPEADAADAVSQMLRAFWESLE